MLKWAITEPRQSYFPETSAYLRSCSLSELNAIPVSSTRYAQSTITPRALRRESVESSCLQLNDKENQITSTPLLPCTSPALQKSPKEVPKPRKLDSFRDLSNIYPPEQSNVTPQRPRRLSYTPPTLYSRYSSTLPTLEVNEYSPSCALIPGPLLALRGIGIPDAYFEKPRYLTPRTVANKPPTNIVEITPSSSQMDDSSLEHMIDAIIASSHREGRIHTSKPGKPSQTLTRLRTMSPTYTPAFDPASDLDEIWWNTEQTYIQGDDVTLAQSHKCHRNHNEQLLCTPKSHKLMPLDEESAFKRRRQRPVRRKRKLTTFRNRVKKSARKLLRVGSHNGMPQLNEDEREERNTQLDRANLSADSGHNSSSGDSTKTEDHEHSKNSNEVVEITKRRLSFSKNHCN